MPEVRPQTVLVIDDTEANRYAVARILRHEGFTVLEAETGAAGLALAFEAQPDLVLLDVRLPDVSGFEVCRRLKEDSRTAATPVVQISASFTDSASRARGLEGGADAYLTHPIDAPVLAATVRAMLRVRQAEQEARRAREHLERNLASVIDAFFVVDHEGRFTFVNPNAAADFGRASGELLGQRVRDVLPGFAETGFFAALEQVRGSGVPVSLEDYSPADGRWLEMRISPTPDGTAVAYRDVTARRETEEQLRQAQKMQAVGQLAGGMAHELNNMLAASIGFDSFALRSLPPGHEARADIEQSLKAQERAARVVQQVLSFSRRQMLQPQVVDANVVVGEVVPLLRNSLAHGQSLRLVLGECVGRVMVDRTQLEQALLNLVLNARDAMRPDGTVTIATSEVVVPEGGSRPRPSGGSGSSRPALAAGRYALVSVEDTGAGMPSEVAARAFEPFFTTKGVGEGTGLGLSMVHGMAHQSGGAVAIDSRPSHGTRVDLYLPLARDEEAPVPAAREPEPGAGQTILVVDDEEFVRAMAARTLTDAGYHVAEAASAEEALAALDRAPDPPALVLCDLVMPGVNGAALGAAIARREPAVPVLFMSGYPGEEASRRGLLREGDAFVPKPFTPETLIAVVQANLAAASDRPA
jgi:PAS domain S-box-containing protein